MRLLMRNKYLFATASVALCTALSFAMFPFFELTNLVMVYLLGTLVVATRGHRGAAAFCSTLSVLCFDFFFVPPRFALTVTDAQYVWTFVVMFVTAMVISHLTIRLRSEAEAARQSQQRTALMHAFTEQLANARGVEDILRMSASRIAETLNAGVAAFLPDQNRQLALKAISGLPAPADKERGIAQWVFDQKQPAGAGTASLPSDESLYVPLMGAEGAVGVISVKPLIKETTIVSEQRRLLESFAHQIALALEVDRLQENARKAAVEVETERLRSSLLSSVSHDLKTPLAAILGSAGTLLERGNLLKHEDSVELLENIQEEGERLSRLIQNLLEATRLESGAVKVNKEPVPLEEVIGSALERLEKLLHQREVKINIPDDLPSVPMDPILLEQVFINLLENGAKHTPPTSEMGVSATLQDESVMVTVSDQGPGINKNDADHLFEKFYRGSSSTGAGLGLAICKAIVSAHGGRIWAENKMGGGALFRFTLPLK